MPFRTKHTVEFTAMTIDSPESRSRLSSHATACFVDVYGEGVLILGDSGIGKSETAIELIKVATACRRRRGRDHAHRLNASGTWRLLLHPQPPLRCAALALTDGKALLACAVQ